MFQFESFERLFVLSYFGERFSLWRNENSIIYKMRITLVESVYFYICDFNTNYISHSLLWNIYSFWIFKYLDIFESGSVSIIYSHSPYTILILTSTIYSILKDLLTWTPSSEQVIGKTCNIHDSPITPTYLFSLNAKFSTEQMAFLLLVENWSNS